MAPLVPGVSDRDLLSSDAVVFMGDLNYRVDANRAAADLILKQGMLEVRRVCTALAPPQPLNCPQPKEARPRSHALASD